MNAWYSFPVTQSFGQNGEKGTDLGTPEGTPLTAPYEGTVTKVGYYPWGGEVDIARPNGQMGYYFLHLDQIMSNIVQGAKIQAGELLGYSGGELGGGTSATHHPAGSLYSSGPHSEFGFLPWGHVNPQDAINQLKQSGISSHGSTPAQGTQVDLQSSLGGFANGVLGGTAQGTQGFLAGLLSAFGLTDPKELFIRSAFMIMGLIIILIGLIITFSRSEMTVVEAAGKIGELAG